MEHIIKQLKNAAKDTRLSAVEKAAIRNQLLHYVNAHPARAEAFSSHFIPSPYNLNNFRNKKTLSAFVVGGLLIGSSVSFAAENTVPGDVLYPVKIHINEQVLGALAVTPQAKAQWDVNLVERRLMEVEKLAVAPSVSPEIKVVAEANFSASTNQVQNQIANFEKENDSKDALATVGKFTEMLRKHEGNLAKRSFGRVSDTQIISEVTSSLQIATTTDTTVTVATSTASLDLDNVLENVRGARGNAEKIQKDLKQKYHTDTMELNTVDTPVVVPMATSTLEEGVVSYRHEHNEEIRTTPSTETGISLPMQTKEASKADGND